MGRHAGWLAAASGLAGEGSKDGKDGEAAPQIILFPERVFDEAAFLASLPADGPPLRRPDPKRALNTLLTLLSLPDKHAN